MKDKITLIIALVSLIGVISLGTIWMCRDWELCVIGIDTFVGIIVAVLALLFTVVIGYQIINTIEVNRKISDIILRQDRIESNYNKFLKLAQNLQSGICKTTADLNYDKSQYLEAFVFYNWALYYAVMADQPNQSIWLKQLRRVITNMTNPLHDICQKQRDILSGTKLIRTTDSYRNYFGGDYENILNELWVKLAQLGYNINVE